MAKPIKGYNINANLSIRVLTVALRIYGDYLFAKNKFKRGQLMLKTQNTLCKQFYIFQITITNIIWVYIIHRRIYMLCKYFIGKSRNRSAKERKILGRESLLIVVQNFVHQHCLCRERVTC
jgi:hypothetical protein